MEQGKIFSELLCKFKFKRADFAFEESFFKPKKLI